MTGYTNIHKGENSVLGFILASSELCRERKVHIKNIDKSWLKTQKTNTFDTNCFQKAECQYILNKSLQTFFLIKFSFSKTA